MMKFPTVAKAIASAVALGGTVSVGAVVAQEPSLTDTVWQLEEIVYNNDTTAVPDNPEDYTIQFFEDGSVGVKADCNVGNGIYDPDSADFITLQAFTLAECGPDSIDDEFRQGLDEAVIFFFQDGDLYMDLPVDTGTMQFVAAEPTPEPEPVEPTPEPEPEPEPQPEPEPAPQPNPEPNEPVRGLW